MPQQDLGLRPPLQRLDHLMTPDPIIMVPCQPSLRLAVLVVLLYVIHIRRHDPASAVFHIKLQNAKTWSVTRRMTDLQTLCDLEVFTTEGLPVKLERQVMF